MFALALTMLLTAVPDGGSCDSGGNCVASARAVMPDPKAACATLDAGIRCGCEPPLGKTRVCHCGCENGGRGEYFDLRVDADAPVPGSAAAESAPRTRHEDSSAQAQTGYSERVERVLASMSPRERVAQLLIAYPQIDKTGPVEVGGVLFVGNSLRDMKKAKVKIASAKERARIPPFIAADIEGGDFNRLKKHPLIKELPFGQQMGGLSDKEVEAWGFATGRAMHEMGLNMNLAPVLDVASSGHMYENRRAFSGDADVVAHKSEAFARGLWRAGVVPIGKHYPGYGDLAGDSDHALVSAEWPIDKVKTQMEVFHKVGPALGGVMMANAAYPVLGDRPAILNPVLVSFAHEHGWITVTDDVSIGVLADAVQGDAADVLRAAFLAGNDLLLTTAPPDWDKGVDYIGVLLATAEESPANQQKVDTACRRILALKERMGLLDGL